MTIWRWAGVVILLFAAVFAVRGGIFTVGDVKDLEREHAVMIDETRTLRRQVDSLRAFHDSLENNPVVQERVAREEWGMIRPGELSIRQERGDSGSR